MRRIRRIFLIKMTVRFLLLLPIAAFFYLQSMWYALRGQPLLQAVYANDVASVRRQLDAGADVHAMYRDPGWEWVPRSALMLACEGGNAEMVRLLLDKGAQDEIDCVDGWMSTPLSVAIVGRNKEVVELLIQRGADVHATVDDETMLTLAEENGDREIVQLLKRADAKK